MLIGDRGYIYIQKRFKQTTNKLMLNAQQVLKLNNRLLGDGCFNCKVKIQFRFPDECAYNRQPSVLRN